MLVLEGVVGLCGTVHLQLLQHYWLGHRLGLLWYWMVCLGNEQRSFCGFWDCIQVLHFGLFCWLWGLLHFFQGILAHCSGQDIMVIWVKFTHSSHFSSLIPKILVFTLAISYLTTSNLPWFMDLTFQVPMQHCSLQHRTLLPSPVTSTTGWCYFGSVSSFSLELFLQYSPVAYWAPTNLRSSFFISYVFAFLYCSWGSQGKNTEVVCHSFLQWTTFCQNSPPWPVHLGWPYRAYLMVSLN